MATITCTKCGKAVDVEEESGDNSTFVCMDCTELANQDAYKRELTELQTKPEKTESEEARIEFLKAKIK